MQAGRIQFSFNVDLQGAEKDLIALVKYNLFWS